VKKYRFRYDGFLEKNDPAAHAAFLEHARMTPEQRRERLTFELEDGELFKITRGVLIRELLGSMVWQYAKIDGLNPELTESQRALCRVRPGQDTMVDEIQKYLTGGNQNGNA